MSERAIGVTACPRRRRHFAAGFSAGAAGFGGRLAVFVLVLVTFRTAGFTDLRAELADAIRELGTTRHFAYGERADVGAAAIEFDAPDHHPDVLFVQARGGAMFARFDAFLAGCDAIFVFLVRHGIPWVRCARLLNPTL